MFRVSNFVVGLANTLVMLVGVSAIGYSIYMFVHQDVTDCESAIRESRHGLLLDHIYCLRALLR
ncbi:unnamed protein product [Brassica oleracea var. botrytis]|uniref:Uncharacterized protein n=1 Tax=Brassica oleracea TaxID=3712 RepID=A0A3P6DSF1_BRAOL|nr:unnamed protein product [Brassica oleracea]